MTTREQIIAAIHRLSQGGKPVGATRFASESGFGEKDWRGVFWARWGDALKEAGLEPNEWQGQHDEAFVMQKLAEVTRHLGKFPTRAELELYKRATVGFPSAKALVERFGGYPGARQRLAECAHSDATYADVAALLGEERAVPREREAAAVEGFVYLIASGNHYKIGRSDQLERRVKSITIKLPEAASLVHAIRTDDPSGIEAYWHRRFADRRANGEWFRLTAADVRAFKRRKFQ